MSVKSGTALLFAAMLVPSLAFAADTSTQGPLAPAGAAGVQKAQSFSDNTVLMVGGGAIVVAGLVLALSGSSHGSTLNTSTTTSTSATNTH